MDISPSQSRRFQWTPPALPTRGSLAKTVFLVQGSSRTSHSVKAALLERGYEVIHAESVEAALAAWARLAVRVDLFLADIALGRDPGVEQLVQLLQAENPRMRVLYANDLETGCPLAGQSYPRQLVAVVENCLA